MFRHGISFIVLVGYLAGQLAMAPRAHVHGIGRADESSQSHIHVFKTNGHGHRHQHGSHGHPHVHSVGVHEHGDDASFPHQVVLTADSDHDDDALYVAAVDQALSRMEQASAVELDASHGAMHNGMLGASTRLALAGAAPENSSPGFSAPHCALYLKLRTLRI